jgi:hypothetical protein
MPDQPTKEEMRESILDAVMVKAIPDEMADAIIALIESSPEPGAQGDVTKGQHLSTSADIPLQPAPDVEEAMDVLSKLAYNHEMTDPNDDLNFKSDAALAVLRDALGIK